MDRDLVMLIAEKLHHELEQIRTPQQASKYLRRLNLALVSQSETRRLYNEVFLFEMLVRAAQRRLAAIRDGESLAPGDHTQ